MEPSLNTPIELITYGRRRPGGAPDAEQHVIADNVRGPGSAAIHHLTGLDSHCQETVLAWPGAALAVELIVEVARALPATGLRRVAVRCSAGTHRSPALAERAASMLRQMGYLVRVRHLHVHLPALLPLGTTTLDP
ncbi:MULTISPECIES: hypothetical protein [unclassified Crossiella]|uniref:RapZ C-terminal domain-containing protein n=1 Tax=unclassified Crossiella TaxID=2620835 RepID=UPI001FFFC169|nr:MULTISPECIES: hypothetical protein [unclassified Crossiella]MCK2245497.1 hypothetical protein [Crossiella sp. S99.2]MCK2259154.1 hypothetical protein [Crossiella sp. S99.1]